MQTDAATDAAIDTALAFFRTNSALDELHPSERAAVRAGLGAIVQLLLARERGAVLVAEFAVSALAGLGGYGASVATRSSTHASSGTRPASRVCASRNSLTLA